MTKLFLRLLILGTLILSSCKENAEDINVAEIDSECGCVESMNIVLKEFLEVKGDKKMVDMSMEERKTYSEKIGPLADKAEEIADYCEKKFPKTDFETIDGIKDCEAVAEFKKIYRKSKN